MFDWMYENGFTQRNTRVNVLTYPDFASIKILPNELRLEVIKEMKKYIAKFSGDEEDIQFTQRL